MASRSNFGLFLLSASSFIGGIALGILLSPKSGRENREWIASNATELADWVDKKGRDAIHEGEERFNHIRTNIHKGIRKNVPDLYEATETIDFDPPKTNNG